MSFFLAAAPAAKPVVPMVASVPHVVVDSLGWEPVLAAAIIGIFIGTGLTYWWSKVGFAGMFSEVKTEIGDLKVDIAKLKATTPTPAVIVTPVTAGGTLVSTPTV